LAAAIAAHHEIDIGDRRLATRQYQIDACWNPRGVQRDTAIRARKELIGTGRGKRPRLGVRPDETSLVTVSVA